VNFPSCRADYAKDASRTGSAASTVFSVSAVRRAGRYLVFRGKLPKTRPGRSSQSIFWQAEPMPRVVRKPCNKAMKWRGPISLLGPICRVRYKERTLFLGELPLVLLLPSVHLYEHHCTRPQPGIFHEPQGSRLLDRASHRDCRAGRFRREGEPPGVGPVGPSTEGIGGDARLRRPDPLCRPAGTGRGGERHAARHPRGAGRSDCPVRQDAGGLRGLIGRLEAYFIFAASRRATR